MHEENMKKHQSLLLSGMLCGIALSGTAADKVFELGKTADSRLKWRGSELITKDYITYLPGYDFAKNSEACKKVKDQHNWTVVNTWGKTLDMTYRKEIGISPDNKAIELNVQMTQPPYKGPANQSSFAYTFKVPLKTLQGMKWKAITGRGCYDPKARSGIINSSTPNGNFIGDGVRWLALDGNGKKLVFDFNPEGVTTFNDFGPNRIQGLWQIRKEGDKISFSFGRTKMLHGFTLNSKLAIFEGSFDDYEKRHGHKKYRYFSELPPAVQYCFGAPKFGKLFSQASAVPYSAKQGFGWLDNSKIKKQSFLPSGAVYSSVYSDAPATFKTKVPKPGLYLVTVRSAAYDKQNGPFALECDSRKISGKIQVNPYTVKTITWPQWLEKDSVEFNFNGKWSVSVVALQLLQHSKEDYRFRRGFWRIAGLYEPSVMHKSAHYAKPPVFQTTITETSLPRKAIKDPAEAIALPPGEICLPNQQSEQMAWRFDATIGSMGPGNNGNFDEFNTPALASRRLKELKAQKINTVLLNGFLSRHTYPNHLDRVQKMVKMTAEEGKKLDIKVIDHWDLTLLWNMGSGFRYLTENTSWLQRTVDGDLPNRGLCPANPEFKKHFFYWVTSFIKDTKIDGIMIDEVAFHGLNFCGCTHCRKQFHDATGLTMPLDETSKLLKNKRSKLWKSWLNWRLAVTEKWWIELRKQINKINPNFTMMRYTTHYGLRSTYGTLTQGASLNGAAHACDFIGTEIMSRNVMASYRAVLAYRKFKNAFREAYGSPIFGLVYPMNVPEFAYVGWVLNNMNAQVTWYISGTPKAGKTNFTAFADNMDLRKAKPMAETALLFSMQSRDWGQSMAYYPDPLGTAECMNDLHMQYTTLIEPCLKYEKLKQYKTVMIPSASCLSDEQINELLKYARYGGKLYLTAHAGMFDQIGNPRKVWPFAKPLGLRNPLPIRFIKGGNLKLAGSKQTVVSKQRFIQVHTVRNSNAKTFMTLTDKLGRKFSAGIETPYGKGKIFYLAGQIGSVNMENEMTVRRKWRYEQNRPVFELFASILGKVTDADKTFIPVSIPEKVPCTVYQQDNSTFVHLLNVTAVNMRKGELVPLAPPSPTFPELKNDLQFKIKLPGVKNAYAASPDFSGHKPVKVEKLANGWYQITLPKALLKCYTVIRINQ
jgi:hypothetical protein